MKNIFKILLLAFTFSSLSTNNLLSNTINGIELKSIVNAWLEEKIRRTKEDSSSETKMGDNTRER